MSAIPNNAHVCELIFLPLNVAAYRQALKAIDERCKARGIDGYRKRKAQDTLRDEMCAGRSSAAALAVANTYLRETRFHDNAPIAG